MKTKTRKTRETRAVYRVRTTRTHAPRVTRPRVVKPAIPTINWEARQRATWQELAQWHRWLNDHEPEFEEKYPGKYLAIWESEIVAIGKTWGEAFDNAAIARPNVGPLIAYIPTEAEAIFAL
ncbi:MAG: hypothetical protein HZC40_08010 [Chloroflexi bacterium]|nr:hypothetical protein [Chloroflexota bacterium]